MRRALALVPLGWATVLPAQEPVDRTAPVFLASSALAQGAYVPTPQNLAARRWFQDAKFGMFIHWGISSLLMDEEWVMENRGIRVAEYERIASYFNPTKFDADVWVALARAGETR